MADERQPALMTLGKNGSARVMVLDVMKDQPVMTAGTGNWEWTLMGPPIRGGEQIEDIVVHLVGRERASQLGIKVRIVPLYDLWTAQAGDDIITSAAGTGDGYEISPVYNTRGKFGRLFQFELGLDDDATPRGARLSIAIAIKTWSR